MENHELTINISSANNNQCNCEPMDKLYNYCFHSGELSNQFSLSKCGLVALFYRNSQYYNGNNYCSVKQNN